MAHLCVPPMSGQNCPTEYLHFAQALDIMLNHCHYTVTSSIRLLVQSGLSKCRLLSLVRILLYFLVVLQMIAERFIPPHYDCHLKVPSIKAATYFEVEGQAVRA